MTKQATKTNKRFKAFEHSVIELSAAMVEMAHSQDKTNENISRLLAGNKDKESIGGR